MSKVDLTLEEAKQQFANVLQEEDNAEEIEQEVAQDEGIKGDNEQDTAQKEGEFDADKQAAQFDVMREARKNALAQVDNIVSASSSGESLGKTETLQCIRALHMVTYMQDVLITSLLGDLVRAIRGMAKIEIDSFNSTAKLFTVTQALYKKGVVTQEDMEKIHQEITIPQLMANLKVDENKKKED